AAWTASTPLISISPMWLTSNRPTDLRTVLCSSITPEYCTGISQPPKSTIRAPMARWMALSGVDLSGAGMGKGQSNRRWREVSNFAGVDTSGLLDFGSVAFGFGRSLRAFGVVIYLCLGFRATLF